MSQILNGKETSKLIYNNLKDSIIQFILKGNRPPKLSIIQVGENPASNLYINNKIRICKKIGMLSEHIKVDENVNQIKLISIIKNLNNDNECDGIIVQLPLPKHLNVDEVINAIDPSKDADGFTPWTIGNVFLGNSNVFPATPKGIMLLLESYNINLKSKNVVIVGRSNIVGKPLALMMINNSATVTVCNSRTKNLKEICKKAEILVTAVGKPKMFDEEFISRGAVIIDVGINKVEDKFVGDCDFEKVENIIEYITPVPGGVGPMTIAALLDNVFNLYKIKMEN